jgi:hypothetical protein
MLPALRFAVLLVAGATFGGCTGGSQSLPAAQPASGTPAEPAPSSPASPPDSTSWLVSDSSSRTATLSLEVTRPPGASSALINGYRAGEARVVVPQGWIGKWSWRNADSSAAHSLVVMVQREKIPLEGGRPAFSNALTKMVTAGLTAGQTDQTTFEADEAGWYWLLCGVPEHALAGEWIELRVDPEAQTATVIVKRRER